MSVGKGSFLANFSSDRFRSLAQDVYVILNMIAKAEDVNGKRKTVSEKRHWHNYRRLASPLPSEMLLRFLFILRLFGKYRGGQVKGSVLF